MNRTVVSSVRMTCDVVFVEKVERFDVKWEYWGRKPYLPMCVMFFFFG